MSKTIEYNGNVYEIGRYYLFGDYEHGTYHYDKLLDINTEGEFETKDDFWSACQELPASRYLGTITKAPIKLEDGCAYMFDILNTPTQIGLYREFNNKLHNSVVDVGVGQCTNILKMVVES